MHFSDRICCLSFGIVDKLSEDASRMMGLQENKAECIRTMLFDFISANGIANNYADIPEKERLEKFFGAAVYTRKAADAPQAEEKGKGKCCCQFGISAYNRLDRPASDALAMLYIQENISLFIRTLFLDFVRANGIVRDYAKIPEKERLGRFFGYTARVPKPAKQPGGNVGTRQGKGLESQPCHPETVRAGSGVTCAMPDGITVRIIVEQASK